MSAFRGCSEGMRDLSLGMVGVSAGNGHPYSFSAIVNGYSDGGFRRSDWGVIHDYLRERDPSEFGFDGVEVTHAWTQDDEETRKLCDAARIPNKVAHLENLVDEVDAVILARDDYENHFEMAIPFLEADMPAFVDKPLSLDPTELDTLKPYLESGMLMSCSGFRYARELDDPRENLDSYGEVKLVRGTVIKSWEKYGIHMIDGIFNVLNANPESVVMHEVPHQSATIFLETGGIVQVDTLGEAPATFEVDIYGTGKTTRHQLTDNFSAFSRTLWHFIEGVRTGEPAIPPWQTLEAMRVLIAGKRSKKAGSRVSVNDVEFPG